MQSFPLNVENSILSSEYRENCTMYCTMYYVLAISSNGFEIDLKHSMLLYSDTVLHVSFIFSSTLLLHFMFTASVPLRDPVLFYHFSLLMHVFGT